MPAEPNTSPEPTEVAAEPELSLAEHEAQYSGAPEASPPTRAGDSDDAPSDAPSSTTTERDASGKFIKTRQRARSQQATPADSPRIAELTRKLREAESERDALKNTRPVDDGSLARAASLPAPQPEVARRDAPVIVAPKPKVDDFQDYGEYVEALADWKIGEARAKDRAEQADRAEATRISTSWRERVEAAKTQHADFEQVALMAPTNIPQGSLVDAWILEHKAGAHVLYHLQKNPTELSSLLAMPMFDQVDALSLLAQRLTPTRSPVATGVSATPVHTVPRPPTPVRTGPQRAADEPPGEEATLAEHEKFYGSRRTRL